MGPSGTTIIVCFPLSFFFEPCLFHLPPAMPCFGLLSYLFLHCNPKHISPSIIRNLVHLGQEVLLIALLPANFCCFLAPSFSYCFIFIFLLFLSHSVLLLPDLEIPHQNLLVVISGQKKKRKKRKL